MRSGGEKQKINIIRNLIKESEVLIMDEASSLLDFETTKQSIRDIFLGLDLV